MQTYRDLIVWQKGIQLVKLVYTLTGRFPKSEMYGLTSQMRRAAASIPANLAEGYTRKHRAEYAQFVRIAFGSGAELETFVTLAEELDFVSKQDTANLKKILEEIMRMLNGLISSLVASR